MANKKSKVELTRININIPKELHDSVRQYANNLGINLTSAFIVLINNGLNNDELLKKLPKLINLYDSINAESVLFSNVKDEVNNLLKNEGIDFTDRLKEVEEEVIKDLEN